MKTLVIITSIVFATATMVNANSLSKDLKIKKLATDTLKKDGIDPVCKMKVKLGTTKTNTFEKVTYGFCSESCKKTFMLAPKKYIKK